MKVYSALNTARQEFHTLKLTKTGENKFAKYKYFELGDFLIRALKVFALRVASIGLRFAWVKKDLYMWSAGYSVQLFLSSALMVALMSPICMCV